ncbi:MAG: AAA family ATPase, partial [Gammaproteobacteria bacterium]|nr:AAA family ATPase [Gammaproteobacteria bacterium]
TESGGFIQLTGEVGTGKTTLVRTLLLNRMPDNADVAVVLNPQLSVIEFLATITEELHIDVPHNKGSVKAQTDALNGHLLKAHAEGRRIILVVDEAQNLAPAVLEQVRLLTNLETARQKLLQIILIGQPELRELLARSDLRQLAQRITGRYHLEPLTEQETAEYIEHRLKVAGALGEVFDTGAKKEAFRLSGGVPRLINVICDRALLGAYSQESRRVDRRLVRRAATEVSGQLQRSPWLSTVAAAAGIVGFALVALTIWWATSQTNQATPGPAAAALAGNEPPPAAAVAEPETLPPDDSPTQPIAFTAAAEAPTGVVADAAAEPEPSLDEQLRLAEGLTTTVAALTALFEIWGLDYQPGGRSACSQASAAGLKCLYQRGSWNRLRQTNLPAILTLFDDGGVTHEVVLTAIDGDRAELSIGGVEVTHPVESIMNAWFGQYLLLWRPPAGAPASLNTGYSGPGVAWLRASLAAVDAQFASGNPTSDVYDAELEQRVREFQRAYRLDVDGVAGQQTQIVVNSLLGDDGTPRLSMPQSAQD